MKALARQIHSEICNVFPTISHQEVYDYIKHGVDRNELFLKINYRSNTHKKYQKEKYSKYRKTLSLANKDSIVLRVDGYSSVEVTKDNRAYILEKRRRLGEIYFNPNAEVSSDFFGDNSSRLGEAYIKEMGLNPKDYIFYKQAI